MIRGSRGRIAFIWPNDGLNDDEYWAYLPQGVAWLTNRFPGTLDDHVLDTETFEASAEIAPMSAAAGMMRAVRPDVVALGDHAGSFVMGKGHDIVQADALVTAAGAQFGTTVSTAIVSVLHSLHVKRIAITSPYDDRVTSRGVDFLQAHGIDVVSSECVRFDDELAIATQPYDFWANAAVRADNPQAEAVVLFGGGIRTAGILPALESQLAKPVIPATAALVWHACQYLGVSMGSIAGCLSTATLSSCKSNKPGRSSKPDNVIEPVKILQQHLSSGTKTFTLGDSPPVFASGQGARLTDTNGTTFLDFACGSGTTVLGHKHPVVTNAIQHQLDTGITHIGPHFHSTQQTAFIDYLTYQLPSELSVVHPATNGSEATESAIKAAMHKTKGSWFISFKGSYHGRTLGALALSHSRGNNSQLGELTPQAIHLPYPTTEKELGSLQEQLTASIDYSDVAGIIVESVQATAGMRLPAKGLLKLLRTVSTQHHIPLIVDEVFTGYGRTGSLFHFQQTGVTPDLLVLAKAASGGIPGALVVGTEEILKSWPTGTQSSTFQLHPLCAAASMATLECLITDKYCDRASAIGDQLLTQLNDSLKGKPGFDRVCGIGAMWGVAVCDKTGAADQSRTMAIRKNALQRGLLTWECGFAR